MIDCLIIGGGPAGYTAAIYAGRSGLGPVLLEGPEPGGQLILSHTVYNFPGFPEGTESSSLMEAMRAQAINCGADVRRATAVGADLAAHRVTLDDASTIDARTIIIATGASARHIGLPSELKYLGMGVSSCATCDGPLCKGKVVAVVGDSDAACNEALYLSGLASKVYLITKREGLRAVKADADRVAADERIEVLTGTVLMEVLGDGYGVTGIRLERSGKVFDIEVFGLFVAIGRTPQTGLFKGQLELDGKGRIVSDGVKTSVPGVFVAGDVRTTDFPQAVTAAADGCRAALEAVKYLRK